MKTLATLSFEHIWLLLFSEKDIFGSHHQLKLQALLPDLFKAMTEEEKRALIEVAKEAKARLLADPDEHGYTPRTYATKEQKSFL
jgi:hypothetical protein